MGIVKGTAQGGKKVYDESYKKRNIGKWILTKLHAVGKLQSGTSITSEYEVFVSYLHEALGKPRHEQVFQPNRVYARDQQAIP
jgi:hypothetical protein